VRIVPQAFIKGDDADETNKKQGKEDKSKAAQANASAHKIVGDAVMGIRTVASFNLEQRFYDSYSRSTSTVATGQKRDAFFIGFFLGLSMLITMTCMGVVFWYSLWLVNEGLIDFTSVMAPLLSIMGVMVPLMKAGILGALPNAITAAVRLFKLFDRVPSIDNLSESGATIKDVVGAISVRNVVFAYPSAPDHPVCKGYTLDVPAGETVALCGPSGSGKSTIVQLLERFYDPQEGMITLDGVDIRTLNVRWLRSQLGYVGQEPVLFQGTVAENIAYGTPVEATQQMIEDAAKMANAHAFITETLSDGYGTQVGQSGGKLSGGQKQRVAIARAVIKKPMILLLDEATSALDNESERIVQAALDEIMTRQKRTTIVIAHRLSTIRGAAKIAVVKEGSIVEEGTHDELISLQGLYTNLVMSS
jgi:ATP-binding cassette subfamily B (MDR/TAP) protein 1